MGYPDRDDVCVSSQAGCGMACPFCATGPGRAQRNLSTGEIVDQVRQAAAAARDGALGAPARLSNVVFMGMGEPLANYKRVVRGAAADHDPRPDGSGSRRAASRSPPSGWSRRSTSWPPRAAGDPRRVPARPRRRAARHPGAGQQPVEGRRGARRRPPLRDHHRPPGVDRVRPDPRRQRPAVARRPARQAAAAADRDQRVHVNLIPLNPTPGQRVGRLAAGCRTSSCAACRPPA